MDWITLILDLAIKVFEKDGRQEAVETSPVEQESTLLLWWTPSLHGSNQKVFGHRRSIVRLIGTMLPLAQAKRVHLDLAVWRYENDYELVSNDANSVSSISDFVDEGRGSFSTDVGNHAPNSDLKQLLEEILELKTKMNEILQRQSVNICCGQSSCCSVGPTRQSAEKPAKLPPPPPPPPPPPMPRNLLEHSTPKRFEKRIPLSNENTLKPGGLSDVLNELKTSKFTLRPVLKSPGGRPLKKSGSESGTPRSDCGGDMLAEILRRSVGNHAPNSDLKQLLEEILELKTKMNEILQRQSVNICCGQSSCCSVGPTRQSAEKPAKLPPPPPPPPPPPMPRNLLEHSTPKRFEKRIPLSNENTLKPGGLSDVLNELKTSKFTLRPVLKSPGGRPLKKSGSESGTPRSDCGGDMLAEILRRRYIKSEITEPHVEVSSSSNFMPRPNLMSL